MRTFVFASAALLGLAACDPAATGASPSGVSRILDTPLTLIDGVGQITVNSSGTITGQFDNQPANLTWTEEGNTICRRGTIGSTDVPNRCQTLRFSGNTVSFINPDGNVSTSYTIGG